jgi:hypothetical protein
MAADKYVSAVRSVLIGEAASRTSSVHIQGMLSVSKFTTQSGVQPQNFVVSSSNRIVYPSCHLVSRYHGNIENPTAGVVQASLQDNLAGDRRVTVLQYLQSSCVLYTQESK